MNKYIAPEGKVYDWKKEHIEPDDCLNAKVIYIGKNDSIDNYILKDEEKIK